MNTKFSIAIIPSELRLKDIPEGTKIILTSDFLDGNAYGKIKHRYSLKNEYLGSIFCAPEVFIKIPENCKIYESVIESGGERNKNICVDI